MWPGAPRPPSSGAETGEQDCGTRTIRSVGPVSLLRNLRRQPDAIAGVLLARGADAATALRRAYGAIAGMVQREAALLSFIDAFHVLGVIFLVMLPLLFLMRRPRTSAAAPAAIE